MENYTKYKLKSSDELASVLNGRDNLFVIACNKCFKEFETVDEPDCGEFLEFAAEQGKTVTGSAKFDFLCNKMHTERKLQDLIPEGTENVVVISCGLGIQTVADLAGKPVIAHPRQYKLTPERFTELMERARACGVAGLECYYSGYDAQTVAKYLAAAEQYGFCPTAGSDWHGKNKPHIHLGSGMNGELAAPYELLEKLRDHE